MGSSDPASGKESTYPKGASVPLSLLTELRRIGEIRQCQLFLSKPYGLELLLIISMAHDTNEDNGIDDTYEKLRLSKPRPEAFRTFVRYLVERECLIVTTSSSKRSKKVLRLPNSIKSLLSQSQN